MRVPEYLDVALVAELSRFVGRYPRLADPGWASSQCRIATDELILQLNATGHSSELVWVRVPTGQLPDATPRALLADAHAIARCDGALVDVTRRQFDPRAAFPTIYRDERHLATDWGQINDDESRRAPWRSLAEI